MWQIYLLMLEGIFCKNQSIRPYNCNIIAIRNSTYHILIRIPFDHSSLNSLEYQIHLILSRIYCSMYVRTCFHSSYWAPRFVIFNIIRHLRLFVTNIICWESYVYIAAITHACPPHLLFSAHRIGMDTSCNPCLGSAEPLSPVHRSIQDTSPELPATVSFFYPF